MLSFVVIAMAAFYCFCYAFTEGITLMGTVGDVLVRSAQLFECFQNKQNRMNTSDEYLFHAKERKKKAKRRNSNIKEL